MSDFESLYSGKKATDARMEVIRLTCKVCGGLQEGCECGERKQEIADIEEEIAVVKKFGPGEQWYDSNEVLAFDRILSRLTEQRDELKKGLK